MMLLDISSSPVGSGRVGKLAAYIFSSLLVRTVPRRRTARIPSAAGAGRRVTIFARRAEYAAFGEC